MSVTLVARVGVIVTPSLDTQRLQYHMGGVPIDIDPPLNSNSDTRGVMCWFGLVSVTLVACVGVTITGASSLNLHQLELKQHYEHLAYIAAFTCHTPQPRVIPVHKLFSQPQLHGKAYFPDVTVLHRCDESSGCCTSGQHCVALREDTLTLPFKITFLEDIENHKKGSWLMEYHCFQNHTECGCSDPLPEPPIWNSQL
ncbi:hypothetical protein J6590_005147 [Homalodisca vitripennis]|nr:hypothetical protein J6590_005147 [Homalodisca vitripennis]